MEATILQYHRSHTHTPKCETTQTHCASRKTGVYTYAEKDTPGNFTNFSTPCGNG